MKHILVTGGAGFIGSNFVRFLLEREHSVRIVNLDALTYAGSMENLNDLPDPERHTFIHGDICDESRVRDIMRRYSIDTVVHFAAESHVDRSINDPGLFVRTNVMGTYSLLEAARELWLVERARPPETVRFHHVSTDEVYGSLGPDNPAWTEATPYTPRSPYAASKASSDHIVRAYGHTYGLPFTITNCSNNYGPRQFPEKLIPLAVLNAVERRRIPVYGDGRQIRDWLHVGDHCAAIHAVLTGGRPGETYNVSGGNQPENLTVVQMLCDIVDSVMGDSAGEPRRGLIEFVKNRPGHDRRYAMEAGKISGELGWRPQMSLERGLHETVEWYLDHTEWVAAVRRQPGYREWIEKNYTVRGEQ